MSESTLRTWWATPLVGLAGGYLASLVGWPLPWMVGSLLAVILVPTKELCDQTYRTFHDLSYYCRDLINVQVRACPGVRRGYMNEDGVHRYRPAD